MAFGIWRLQKYVVHKRSSRDDSSWLDAYDEHLCWARQPAKQPNTMCIQTGEHEIFGFMSVILKTTHKKHL